MKRIRKRTLVGAGIFVAMAAVVFTIIGNISFASGDGNEPFLDNYVEYGIVCNMLNQTADMETNFVAGKYIGNGQYIGNSVSENMANAAGMIRAGEVVRANGESGSAKHIKVRNSDTVVYVDERVKTEVKDFLKKVLSYSKSVLDESDSAVVLQKARDMNNYEVDISQLNNKVVYLDADIMAKELMDGRIQNGGVKLKLREEQTLVLNISEDGEFFLPRYTVKVTDGKKTKEEIAQTIIWNLPNVDSLRIGSDGLDATVIAPQAMVNIVTTGEGWLVCDTIVSNSGEWHMIYRSIPKNIELPKEEETAPPTKKPTAKPTAAPTKKPTAKPTAAPTKKPTEKPTAPPTAEVTTPPEEGEVTDAPTAPPVEEATAAPTKEPTTPPEKKPTEKPTTPPEKKPTAKPTTPPEKKPTEKPTTPPEKKPTEKPTTPPEKKPTEKPTNPPENKATERPTNPPTAEVTDTPDEAPTAPPVEETEIPSLDVPTENPSEEPLETAGVTPPVSEEMPEEEVTPAPESDSQVPPSDVDGTPAPDDSTTTLDDNGVPKSAATSEPKDLTTLDEPGVPRSKAMPESKQTTILDSRVPLSDSAPKTGDDTNLLLPAVVMGVSALGIVVILVMLRRKKR